MKRILLSLFITSSVLAAHADEGMWMLTDLQKQNEVAMTELGLLIPANQIYNPDGIALKDAVVHFGGGCTGEVISAEGLVLTNHHCGYSAIQQHSSVEHDYLTDGFWAMSREEELPCKGLTVTYVDRILDVTDYVNEQLKTDDDPNGTNYLSPKYLKTVADRFAKSEGITLTPGRKLELKAFYGGNRYYLFVKTTYSDIRMVGAPPSSIGKCRHRQLDVAPPHGRFLHLPHLCRQRRETRRLQQRQRPPESEETPHHQPRRLSRGRLYLRHGLPRTQLALHDFRRSRGTHANHQLHAPPRA